MARAREGRRTPPAQRLGCVEIDLDEPLNPGFKIHVWNDVPQLEDENGVGEGIYPRRRVLAQKTWNSEKLVESYQGFQTIMDTCGRAPGYQ